MTREQVRSACQRLIESGLTAVHFTILHDLDSESLTPTDLAKRTGTCTANVTSQIDRMEKNGLVERKHRADDRRSTFVQLTEAGKAKLESVQTK